MDSHNLILGLNYEPKSIGKSACLSPFKTNGIFHKATVEPVLSGHSRQNKKLVFKTKYRLSAGQMYCRILQGEHSAILSTFIKLPFVFKIFVLSISEWPLKTGFTVHTIKSNGP